MINLHQSFYINYLIKIKKLQTKIGLIMNQNNNNIQIPDYAFKLPSATVLLIKRDPFQRFGLSKILDKQKSLLTNISKSKIITSGLYCRANLKPL